MRESKTIERWYKEVLPNGYSALALWNTANQDRVVDTIYEAVDRGMHWVDTDQGHTFWRRVAHSYDRVEPLSLPPLPENYALPCAPKPESTPVDVPVAEPMPF